MSKSNPHIVCGKLLLTFKLNSKAEKSSEAKKENNRKKKEERHADALRFTKTWQLELKDRSGRMGKLDQYFPLACLMTTVICLNSVLADELTIGECSKYEFDSAYHYT